MEFGLRILIVDDEPLILGLLTEIITSLGHEVTSAQDAAGAKRAMLSFDPDIALLDVDLGPGPSGIDLAVALSRLSPGIGILFLSNLADPKLAGHTGSLPKGSGYLLKSKVQNAGALVEALKSVTRSSGSAPRENDSEHALRSLSRTQLEVIRLVSQGKSNEEIAELRGTTVRAVRQTIARASKAMGIPEDGGPEKRVLAALNYIRVAGLPK